MFTDAQTRFSNAQAVTTGTEVSTNAYDMGTARDIGRGRGIRVIATVGTAFAGGTSLVAKVIESAAADLGTPTILYTGPVVVEASLTAGALLMDTVLPTTSKRYLGLQFVTVGTHSAGTVNGGLVLDTDSNVTFAANTGL